MAEQSDNKPVSGILVPIGIVLIGILIVWGITRMLNAESGYKKLVQELHSKTFGNRWVAAYELSKYISSAQIPKEDIPWLVDQLTNVYEESRDPRTKNFIVLTLGALEHPDSVKIFNKALQEEDQKIVFSSIMAIGNLNSPDGIDFNSLTKHLSSKDSGVVQVAILSLVHHDYRKANSDFLSLMSSANQTIKYSAASGALAFGELSALPIVKEVFQLKAGSEFDEIQIQSLMLNVLTALDKSKSFNKEIIDFVQDLSASQEGLVVKTKAKELLLKLKKY